MAHTIAQHTTTQTRPGRRMPSLRRGVGMLRASLVGAALLVAGTSALQNAVANGDTRTLTFKHMHRGETASFTFKKNGRYDSAVLQQMNWYFRDWRNDKQIRMDPQLFDILWEVSQETRGTSAIHVLSSYRSPETNTMLRSRSRGVAKFSQHTLGKAMDFYIPGVALDDLRSAGLRLQRGGVGFYPTSGSPFVHMDTGSVRHWPRMTRSQLARVFPDGKTIHVPSDGKPFAGYEAALAEAGSRSGASGASASKPKNFFAALFGGGRDEEEESVPEAAPAPASHPVALASPATMERDDDSTPTPAPARQQVMSSVRSTTVMATAMPLPASRPQALAPANTLDRQAARGATTRAEATTVASAAPMPVRRPSELAAASTTRVARLEPAPLPTVITRGSEREESRALGYAADGEIFGPTPASRTLAAPTPARRTAETRRNRREQAVQPRMAFGHLFLSPRLADTLYMRPPEVRVFTSFVTAPRDVVISGFSQDASYGLTSSFTGEAIATVYTQSFAPPAFAQSGR